MIFTIICCAILVSLLVKWIKHINIYQLPPGPGCYPIIGNALGLGRQPHKVLAKWAAQYGRMFTIHFGVQPVVVLNDANIMRELLGRSSTVGKYTTETLVMLSHSGKYGLLNTDGALWEEQVDFCFRALHQFGFEQQEQMETLLLQEAIHLCRWIRNMQFHGGSIYLREQMDLAMGLALWNMITGDGEKDRQLTFQLLISDWRDYMHRVTASGVAALPWLKYLMPEWSGYNGLKRVCAEMQEIAEQYFESHKYSRRKGNEGFRDLIDAYINQVEYCMDRNSTFYGQDGWRHSISAVVMLLLTSMESTGSLVMWLIFYCIANPRVQQRMQEELDSALHRHYPSLVDRPHLSYVDATIWETIRISSLTALGGAIKLLGDVEFQGYNLPKGLVLLPNFHYVHNDRSVWGDPENFRPERFLEEGGQRLKEYVVSFQPGQRACPGQGYAKDAAFLFTATLFKFFSFAKNPNMRSAQDYLTPEGDGFIFTPRDLSVLITHRRN